MDKKYRLLFGAMAMAFGGCALFEAPDETKNVQERLINFPNVTINGESIIVFDADQTNDPFEDPGAAATFGDQNVTDEIVVGGLDAVDTNVPGVYTVTYNVEKTNSLGTEVSAGAARRVFVVCASEDNLSGEFTAVSRNWSAGTSPEAENDATITQIGPGLYRIPDYIYGRFGVSTTGAEVYDICGMLEFPTQPNLAGLGLNWGGTMEVTDVGPDGKINEFIFRFSVISAATRAEITYTRK